MNNTCDIVIPTYNSANVIPHAITALQNQNIPQNWSLRLVISDDGSTDNTIKQIVHMKNWRKPLIISNTHAGIAHTRNAGIHASDADIILLLGSDIILRPNAIKYHLNFHTKNTDITKAALGLIKWDPRIHPSPFMEWMMHGGQQNDFDALLGTTKADPKHFFYGAFLSLKRKMMDTENQPFHQYGWEDISTGRHLAKKGLTITVLHNAAALHRHYYTTDDIFKRQYTIGAGIHTYQQQHKEVLLIPPMTIKRRIKLFIYRATGIRIAMYWILRISAHKYATPRMFSIAASTEFWFGTWKTTNT